MNRIIQIPLVLLKRTTYILISLPMLVFSIFWLKWYWTLPILVSIIIINYLSCFKRSNQPLGNLDISCSSLLVISIIVLIWVWLSGTGGFWGQTGDYPFRNAIFRDIILRPWPVIYKATGHALVYYIGFWLFPALFGKLFLLFGADDTTAFNVSSIAVFFWTFIILMTMFLLIIRYLHAFTRKKQIFLVLLFIFFSGMDIICNIGGIRGHDFHLEWWTPHYQYSSFTTCLFWVFNQALPAWLCFICLLNEEKISNYVYIGMMCLFCAPLPFVGLFVFAVTLGIIRFIRAPHKKDVLREIFSFSNIVSVIILFPIIAAYLLSNDAIHGDGSIQISEKGYYFETDEEYSENSISSETDSSGRSLTYGEVNTISRKNTLMALITFVCIELIIGLLLLFKRLHKKWWYFILYIPILSMLIFAISQFKEVEIFQENIFSTYFSFVCIEFLLYMIMMFGKYKRNPLYYVTAISLLLIPFVRIGYSTDFAMRASIPGLVMVYLMVAQFLMEDRKKAKIKHTLPRLCYILLAVFLCFGTVTPIMEMYRNSRSVYRYGLRPKRSDSIYTLGCDGPYDEPGEVIIYANFVASNPTDHLFFKFFSKRSE